MVLQTTFNQLESVFRPISLVQVGPIQQVCAPLVKDWVRVDEVFAGGLVQKHLEGLAHIYVLSCLCTKDGKDRLKCGILKEGVD